MGKKKWELSKKEKLERKKAKKMDVVLEANEAKYKCVICGMNATWGISLSQASPYEKGELEDNQDKHFLSQDYLSMFAEGYGSDSSSDSDW